ncbi:MAG: hypothetical protein IJU76_14075 [Desulfovibrionaceae bacterium]|nr:hypothetical protein [Desulfovibrionaceae bacterium]
MDGFGTITLKLGSDDEVYWKNQGQGKVVNGVFYLQGCFKDNKLVLECDDSKQCSDEADEEILEEEEMQEENKKSKIKEIDLKEYSPKNTYRETLLKRLQKKILFRSKARTLPTNKASTPKDTPQSPMRDDSQASSLFSIPPRQGR